MIKYCDQKQLRGGRGLFLLTIPEHEFETSAHITSTVKNQREVNGSLVVLSPICLLYPGQDPCLGNSVAHSGLGHVYKLT